VEERLEDDWVPLDEKMKPEELEELIHSKEAHTNAVVLESVRNNLISFFFSVLFIFNNNKAFNPK
jgi:hypothetical protein